MVRYAPITSRDDAPELAPLPRVVVAGAAVGFALLGGWLGWSAWSVLRSWDEFRKADRITVTLAGSEGEIEQAIARSTEDGLPLELDYRVEAKIVPKPAEVDVPVQSPSATAEPSVDRPGDPSLDDGPAVRGRFHRFAGTVPARASPFGGGGARTRARRAELVADSDIGDWLLELRSASPMTVSRVGTDLVSRIDRPDARGETIGLGLFAVPLLTAAAAAAVVAITGNPIRSRRSPVLFVYVFHAVCLLPLTVLAVVALGLAAPIARALRIDAGGLAPEAIGFGVYGLLLILLVPWVGFFVRFNQWTLRHARPDGDGR